MRKIFYLIVVVIQGMMILSTIINIIYCVITTNDKLFNSSIYLLYLPYSRFIKSGNYFDVLILIILLVITIAFYVLSIKEIFDDKNKKAPFLMCNGLWFIFSTAITMWICINTDFSVYFDGESYIGMAILYGSMYIMHLILLVLKWNKQNKNIRMQKTLRGDEFLPEHFQLEPTGYAQIVRTAKGSPVIATICFFLCLLICYLNSDLFQTIYLIYGISAAIMVVIFITTIVDFKELKVKSREEPPIKNSLAKLNKMQLISFVLFILSFGVINLIKLVL